MNVFFDKFQVIAAFEDPELTDNILSTYSVFPCSGFDVVTNLQPTRLEDLGCIKGEFSLEGLDKSAFDNLFSVITTNMERTLTIYEHASDMGWAIITKISPGKNHYMGWTYCKGLEHNGSNDVLRQLITTFITNKPSESTKEKYNVRLQNFCS